MDLKKLTVTLEVNTGAYKNALRAARQETEKSAEVARSASNSIKKSMSSVSTKGFMSGIKGRIKNYQLKAGIKVPTESGICRLVATGSERVSWKGLQYDFACRSGRKIRSCKRRMEKKDSHKKVKEYEKTTADLKNAEAALNRYYEKKDKLEHMGTDKESKIWKGLQYDIRNAEEAVKD